jgi:hypothetical protein
MSKLNTLLHNQTFWRIIWSYTIIIYGFFIIFFLINGEPPVLISKTFTKNLFFTSGIIITPLMLWGAYNQFRISRNNKNN